MHDVLGYLSTVDRLCLGHHAWWCGLFWLQLTDCVSATMHDGVGCFDYSWPTVSRPPSCMMVWVVLTTVDRLCLGHHYAWWCGLFWLQLTDFVSATIMHDGVGCFVYSWPHLSHHAWHCRSFWQQLTARWPAVFPSHQVWWCGSFCWQLMDDLGHHTYRRCGSFCPGCSAAAGSVCFSRWYTVVD